MQEGDDTLEWIMVGWKHLILRGIRKYSKRIKRAYRCLICSITGTILWHVYKNLTNQMQNKMIHQIILTMTAILIMSTTLILNKTLNLIINVISKKILMIKEQKTMGMLKCNYWMFQYSMKTNRSWNKFNTSNKYIWYTQTHSTPYYMKPHYIFCCEI